MEVRQDNSPDKVASFVCDLRRFGSRTALIDPEGNHVTFRQLDRMVDARVAKLGIERRLVLLRTANDVETIVDYLACLRGGHPVMLVERCNKALFESLRNVYSPDVIADAGNLTVASREIRTFHPELALLMTTSGSTGSPKLVRLSHHNLSSNASAIAQYLELSASDRAITSLPLNYCYGLSIINSHLSVGASVVLTNRSVVDKCFWSAFIEHEVTGLAGVPYTFDMLERVEFDEMTLPSLRYITQAGGRLDPARVKALAESAEHLGRKLYVMYGQTEATARIAYLPPELAALHPNAIGIPIPGGTIRIDTDHMSADGSGELIYSGPNVMLGYAYGLDDLASGRTLGELRTGDIARLTEDGLYEIVGRKSRFAKLFGLRIDLDDLQSYIARAGHDVICTTSDSRLKVVTTSDASEVQRLVTTRLQLPLSAVTVVEVEVIPRLKNGKPDYSAIDALCRDEPLEVRIGGCSETIRSLYATALGVREVRAMDTFVSLGGDSLSYVEVSMGLEQLLGYVPANWQTIAVGDLEANPVKKSSKQQDWAWLETDVVLRAMAIVMMVGSHVKLFHLVGGAHLLLVITGWNFARFALGDETPERSPSRRITKVLARIAVPSVLWIGFRVVISDKYVWPNLLLINNYLRKGAVGYWYIEVLAQLMILAIIALAVPSVARCERKHRFGFAMSLLLLASAARFVTAGDFAPARDIFVTHMAAWFFFAGWAARRATNVRQRLAVGAVAGLMTATFFGGYSNGFVGDATRIATVIAGTVVLLIVTRIPVPRIAASTIGLIASSSLYIYLLHFTIYPSMLSILPPIVVTPLAIGAGIAAWSAIGWTTRRIRQRHRQANRPGERSKTANSQYTPTESLRTPLPS